MTGTTNHREYVEIGDWWDQAACRRSNPSLFFADLPADIASAKMVCAGCPVREECLGYAMANGEKHGVWGGLTPVERRQWNTDDIATMFNVRRNTVGKWKRRGLRRSAEFPPADGVVDGRTVWRAEDVIDWARRVGRPMRGGS